MQNLLWDSSMAAFLHGLAALICYSECFGSDFSLLIGSVLHQCTCGSFVLKGVWSQTTNSHSYVWQNLYVMTFCIVENNKTKCVIRITLLWWWTLVCLALYEYYLSCCSKAIDHQYKSSLGGLQVLSFHQHWKTFGLLNNPFTWPSQNCSFPRYAANIR